MAKENREELAKRTKAGDPGAIRKTRAHYEALAAAAKDLNDMKGRKK